MKRYRIFVSGKVQGVFYRDFTMKCASLLGIKGWVKNLPDGRVEIFAEADEQNLMDFVAKLRVGPENAYVKNVIVDEIEANDGLEGFEIIR